MESFNDVISSNTLILVDSSQHGVSHHPMLEKLKAQMVDRIRVIKVDIDKHQDTAAQYDIQSVPTMMLFKSGQQLTEQREQSQSCFLNSAKS